MKSLKFLTILSSPLLVAVSSLSAAPAISIGESTALFFRGSAGLDYNSNVFRAASGSEDDFIFVVTPGLEVQFATQGSAISTLRLGYEMRRHDTFSGLNGEFLKSSFTTSYDSGIYQISGNASYNEFGTTGRFDDADPTSDLLLPGLNERSETRVGGNAKYRFSDQLAVGGGVSFRNQSYKANPAGVRTLTDLDTFEVPVRVFYNIQPRLDLVTGYRLREVNVARQVPGGQAPDFTTHYFFVGVDGELFNPLWKIEFDIGHQERKIRSGGDSTGSLSFNTRVTYNASATRSYFGAISRDFIVSPSGGQSYVRNQLTLGGNYKIAEMWGLNGSVTYLDSDYKGSLREEELILVTLGASYNPNEYLTIRGQVRVTSADGSNGGIDYDQQVLSLTASFRY